MVKIDKQVTISDKIKLFFEARLVGDLNGDIAKIDIVSDEVYLNIEGYDFFDCLIKLREFLEKKKLFILCQGSAINVYPSRMARDMSSGLKAYSLELGKKTSLEQLVEIFDPAPVEAVGLIIEQNAFFERWIETPKH